MNAATRDATLDPAAVAPVRYGTAEFNELIAAIGASARESKAAGKNPFPAIDLARAARLGAIRVPAEQGGGGASMHEFFRMQMQLAEADSDVAQILRAHFWFTEDRMRERDPIVRERWIKHVVDGEIFGNAVVEIGQSRAVGDFAFQTALEPDGAGYRLNGTKYYCTGSLFSDWVWVFASTPDGGMASVFVPVDREGVTLEDDWDGVGQCFTGSGTGRFDNVYVNAEEVVQTMIQGKDEIVGKSRLADALLTGQFVQLILPRSSATCAGSRKRRLISYAHASERSLTRARTRSPPIRSFRRSSDASRARRERPSRSSSLPPTHIRSRSTRSRTAASITSSCTRRPWLRPRRRSSSTKPRRVSRPCCSNSVERHRPCAAPVSMSHGETWSCWRHTIRPRSRHGQWVTGS